MTDADLINKLRNPPMMHGGTAAPRLDDYEVPLIMRAAAARLEELLTMTVAVARVEALLEGIAKSGIYVLDRDEAVAVLRRALDRADRHEAGVLETLTLMGIVLARRGS